MTKPATKAFFTEMTPGKGRNHRSVQHRKVLLRLWNSAKGKCHWCGEKTVLPWHVPSIANPKKLNGRMPPVPLDTATRDHLASRFKRARGKHSYAGGVVLACKQCNEARGRAEEVAHGLKTPLTVVSRYM